MQHRPAQWPQNQSNLLGRALFSPARHTGPRAPIPAACAQPSMQRLSDVGELGLLRELERRGLVHGIEDDTAQVAGAVAMVIDPSVARAISSISLKTSRKV